MRRLRARDLKFCWGSMNCCMRRIIVARREGFTCLVDTETDNWPLEKAAEHLLAQLEILKKENPRRRVAIFAGGEVSSPVTGDGVGGRNSAFVLACVPKIAGKRIAVLSAGTDGVDGNSPAAGAVADGETLARASAMGLECWGVFAAL